LKPRGSGEIKRILEDRAVERWLQLARATGRSSESVKYGSYVLKIWAGFFKKSPAGLVELARKQPGLFRDRVVEMLSDLRGRGRTSATVKSYYFILRSFLKANGVDFELDARLRTWVEKPIRPVTREELRRLRAAADPRMRALIDCLKDSGLAPSDLLELDVGDVRAQLEANQVPVVIEKVRRKTKIKFYTFFGPEAISSLKAYLEMRRNLGINTSDESPLFVRRDKAGIRMRYDNLAWMFNMVKKRAGIKNDRNGRINLYSLRKYFTTNLRASGINELYPKIWSGHSLGVEASYFMPGLEDQKKQYMQHYGALVVEEHGTLDLEKLRKQQLLDTARLLGIPPDQVEKIKSALDFKSFDEIVETLQNSLKYESRYASEEELPNLVSQGWEVVFPTPINGKILVRRRRLLFKNEKEKQVEQHA